VERRYDLVAFDMDGVLVNYTSCWTWVHDHFKVTNEASLKAFIEGDIDDMEFMRRDIGSWPKPVTREEVKSVLSRYKIRTDAPETLEGLRGRGIDIALVTSGIDILAEMVARELGIKHWVANGLQFDANGRVRPNGIGRVDPTRKDKAYLRLLKEMRIQPENTIAVGDTIYDLAFLKSAAKGFMLAHSTRVDDPSIIHIERLSEILNYI
jgi:phosphoserine phosphatase